MQVIALRVFTFGAFAYGAVLVCWFRELGHARWGVIQRDSAHVDADGPSTAMIFPARSRSCRAHSPNLKPKT
jgi:hypothetical protein